MSPILPSFFNIGSIQSLTQAPTSLRLQVATKGGVNVCIDKAVGDTAITDTGYMEGDKKWNWYMVRTATAVSAEFDTAVVRTGRCSMKLSTTDATGQLSVYSGNDLSATYAGLKELLIPIKASTKYILNIFARGYNLTANSVYATINTYDTAFTTLTTATSNKLGAGNSEWTLLQATITTGANDSYAVIGLHNMVAGTISDAFFDVNSIQILDTQTNTTNANAYPAQIKPSFIASNNLTGIDLSLDPTGAYADTYAVPTAIDEGATHRQTFTPTKKHLYRVGFFVTAKGTGNFTLTVHDSANNAVGGVYPVVANANITDNAWNYFDIGLIWTTGAYHFHLVSSVNDATIKSNTNNDMEDASYILLYGRAGEGSELIANGVRTKILADRDGILTGSVIDIANSSFEFYTAFGSTTPSTDRIVDLYSWTGTNRPLNNNNGLLCASSGSAVIKINTIFPIKKISISSVVSSQIGGESFAFQISNDGINWTTLDTVADTGGNVFAETDQFKNSIVFIKPTGIAGGQYITSLYFKADIDTSSVQIPIFYPVNSIIQEVRTIKVRGGTTLSRRIYFRTAKYANENGVVQPCLEIMNSSGNATGAILFLDMDNSQETNPSVNINIAETTNSAQSGTGSNDSTTGYILNDGEYMTLSANEDDLKITYKVGYGTTTFNNPTKNAYYLSSPANSADNTQDPSLESEVIIGIPQKSILSEVNEIHKEINRIKQYPNTKSNLIIAGGTAYTLTTSLTQVTFGTSGNLEMRINEPGLYEVTADIHEDLSALTVSAAANYSLFQLYKDGNAVANTERIGTGISILAGAIAGVTQRTAHLSWIIRLETANSLISVFGKQNSATTGAWNIVSDATGRTRLGIKRLGN